MRVLVVDDEASLVHVSARQRRLAEHGGIPPDYYSPRLRIPLRIVSTTLFTTSAVRTSGGVCRGFRLAGSV